MMANVLHRGWPDTDGIHQTLAWKTLSDNLTVTIKDFVAEMTKKTVSQCFWR
jgi:hypothetical protein